MAQSRQQNGRIRDRRVLGTFSTDENRRYRNDDRNRRIFVEPDNPLDFDYARGFGDYVDMGDDEGDTTSLDNVLSWIGDHKKLLKEVGILDSKRSRLNMDFVGRRGTFKELLSAGGNMDADIELFVTLYRGTYYLSQFWTPEDKSRQPLTRKQQMIAASSKLFLQFVTSKEGCEADSYAPLNDNASYYAMMSALCGKHRMLFSYEVQAEGKDELKRLKTSPSNYLNIRTNGQASLNPKKALKWWAPNALSDIPKIVCGLRDDRRKLVRSIEYIHTDRIPEQYAKNEWAPDACMETMESLLSQIKEMVQDDDMSSVYHLALERVEGDRRRSYHQRPSRRFVSHGKRTDDDCTLIKEELINAIFE